MREKPRSKGAFIISREMGGQLILTALIFSIALLGVWGYWAFSAEALSIRELTLFFTLFVLLQFWNMLNVRSLGSKESLLGHWSGCRSFLLVWLFIGLGQVAIVEWGGEIFRTEPLSLKEWLLLFALSSLSLLIGGGLRWLRCKKSGCSS